MTWIRLLLTSEWKDLNLTQTEMLLILQMILDVDKVSNKALSFITEEYSTGLLKNPLKGGARFVESCVVI